MSIFLGLSLLVLGFSNRGIVSKLHKVSLFGAAGSRTSYGSEIIDSAHANGVLKLEGTTISGLASVNGSLHAQDAQIALLEVNGSAYLNKCIVTQKAQINGVLSGTHNRFDGELSIACETVKLQSSTAQSIMIRAVEGYSGVQILELTAGAKVTGVITFVAGNGEIVVDEISEFSGSVIGGKVRKK